MSHTDKDEPIWIQCEWFVPQHYYLCNLKDCDLPAEPPREREIISAWRRSDRRCYWKPYWPYHQWRTSVPKWFRDHIWNNSQRRRLRDQLILAKKEYNSTKEIDVIPNIDQHRHCAWWLWS